MKVILTILFSCSLAYSQVAVLVKSEADVSGKTITLGEIAEFRVAQKTENNFASQLAAIELGASPQINTRLFLSGQDILDTIKKAGFSEDKFVYAIPVQVGVSRPGVLLNESLIRDSLARVLLDKFGADVELKRVSWQGNHLLEKKNLDLKFRVMGEPRGGGQVPITIIANNQQIPANAYVKHFRMMPVAKHSLSRGQRIDEDSIDMVKMDISKLPEDILFERDELVGLQAMKRVPVGEPLRASSVNIPPLVVKGQSVMMKFISGALEVTGKGKALEDGRRNDVIKLKNTDSRKEVFAKVVSPTLVEVMP